MNTVLKSLVTPLLCLCLVGGLLSGCTSSNSSQDTSTEYLSEQTQTESFPVRLEIGEENHIIKPCLCRKQRCAGQYLGIGG